MQKHIHGGDIYSQDFITDYSANINPLGVPKGVARAVIDSVSGIGNYPDPDCRRLRAAMAVHEQAEEEQLIFGNGASDLIFALAFGMKPKKALLTAPCFAEYEQALQAAGCTVSYYELQEELGFVIQEDYLERITGELDLLFLCNPNNPTGVVIPDGLLEKIESRCRKYKVLMVMDECFCGFLDDPKRHSMNGCLPESDYIFILKAFTKLYAMPGLRLGYGICSNLELLDRMRQVMQPWSVSVTAQQAGLAALEEQEYIEESRRMVHRERLFLIKALQDLGLTTYDSRANFIFFKGPAGLLKSCAADGYLIRDCSNYRGLKPGYYRIAVRTSDENTAFIEVLGKILKNNRKEGGKNG